MLPSLCALLAPAAVGLGQSDTPPRPNFLFVLVDDMGIGDFGVYQSWNHRTSDSKTPEIDKFASEHATIFTHGYSAHPVCSPSRTAWMTGRFPAEVGIHSALPCAGCEDPNRTAVSCGCAGFVDPYRFPTVTNVLHDVGYKCGHFGKWHMGASSNTSIPKIVAPSPGEAYGIDDSATFDSNAQLSYPDDAARKLYPDAPNLIPPNHPKNPLWNSLSSAAVTNNTLAFIDNATASGHAAPWYVNAWFHTAHATLDPTPGQLAMVGNATCRSMSPNAGQHTCGNQIYYAAILDADQQIGLLFDGLRARGAWENTVIALSADNGPEVRWSYPNSVGNSLHFRGQKRSLYDGGIRMPFLMAWPGRGPGGNVDDTSVVSAVDWLPTVLALANVTVPPALADSFRGHDISATFVGKGAPAPRPAHKPLLWEWRYNIEGPCYMEAPQLAVLDPTGQYKLLMNPPGMDQRVELFSRLGRTDLFEAFDLSRLLPDKVAELTVPLLQFHAESQAAWPGEEFPKPGCAGEPWPPKIKATKVAEGTTRASRRYPMQDP